MARDEAQDMTAPTSIDIIKNAATMMSSTSLGDSDITSDQKFHGATCHRQVKDIIKNAATMMSSTSLCDIDITSDQKFHGATCHRQVIDIINIDYHRTSAIVSNHRGMRVYVLKQKETWEAASERQLDELKDWHGWHMRWIKVQELLIEVDNELDFIRHYMPFAQRQTRSVEDICKVLPPSWLTAVTSTSTSWRSSSKALTIKH
jgi:hypothetical protein